MYIFAENMDLELFFHAPSGWFQKPENTLLKCDDFFENGYLIPIFVTTFSSYKFLTIMYKTKHVCVTKSYKL